ncbi:TIGR01244 family sulfur transferase [Paracoccus sp. SCSIO 75233]|uniref:TIGR01244 family sulfur transferase n=1 Tax=Paracoccus sp. SCSIO 75233 TaxID=3017782 RepID=UPI0022F05F2D|nr:TIGR01244 family sulfur transferase [Paracoccus sp. SCSIO 75233]WBU54498.1 TIGR01244 family sulfur transferase [Paracoccus sp. SCSIO 75233]
MDVRKINDRISVAPQILPQEVAEAAEMGFRTIICNRPDGEESGQPAEADIAAAASAAGLEYRFLPIWPGSFDSATIDGFGAALEELPGPVLAYCRSGTRSATVWSLSQSGRLPPEQILSETRAAGYDLSGIAAALRQPE